MKKILPFCLFFLLTGLALQGQITLGSDDVAPLGNSLAQSTDTMPDASITVGGMGNQSWDFSALNTGLNSQVSFVEASQTPYFDEFPTANIAGILDTIGYLYLRKTSDLIEVVGNYASFDSINLAIDYPNPQTLLQFPTSYNDQFSDRYKTVIVVDGALFGLPLDSFRIESTGDVMYNVDAYGQMTTPLGTFNVLRMEEMEVTFDTSYAQIFGMWTQVDASEEGDTSYSYTWWTNANGLGFPLVQVDIDSETGSVESATWLEDFLSSTARPNEAIRFSVYPNPASDWVTVEVPADFSGRVRLIDFNGKQLSDQPLRDQSNRISLDKYPAGNYLIYITDEDGKIRGFRQVNVE